MPKTPNILVLIDTTKNAGRGLLRGLANYSKLYDNWNFIKSRPWYLRNIHNDKEISVSEIDGVIAYQDKDLEEFKKHGIPCIVSLITQKELLDLPHILSDDATAGKLAAEHFKDRGFRNFGYYGIAGIFWAEERFNGFKKEINEGCELSVFRRSKETKRSSEVLEENKVIKWLEKLEKPAALFACNDDLGEEILEFCRKAAIKVPEEIAVIGVDNDEFICDLTNPPLSSVILNFEKTGFQAGALMTRLLKGEKMKGQTIITEAAEVKARASSDIIAVDDSEVAKAIRFIRNNKNSLIQVDDVVDAVSVSRRTLEQKFREVLTSSVSKTIRKNRAEHIAKLLIETDQPISRIAYDIGYSNVTHIARFFKNEKGLNPQEFRNKYKTVTFL